MKSFVNKLLVINSFIVPDELKDIITGFVFHRIKKIQKNDERYEMLLNIPEKEYDDNGLTFVYLTIDSNKDFFLTYSNFEMQLQTFEYHGNRVICVEGHSVSIV